jgi:hypothetical protein
MNHMTFSLILAGFADESGHRSAQRRARFDRQIKA